MLKNAEWTVARDLLLNSSHPVESETIPLQTCAGRVLAFDLLASSDVPLFDRSAYDGYALRSDDVREASKDHPVVLKITETIPAGSVGSFPVEPGQAAHVMTGAKIPEGADCAVMFEKTQFTETDVTLFAPLKPGGHPGLSGIRACSGL